MKISIKYILPALFFLPLSVKAQYCPVYTSLAKGYESTISQWKANYNNLPPDFRKGLKVQTDQTIEFINTLRNQLYNLDSAKQAEYLCVLSIFNQSIKEAGSIDDKNRIFDSMNILLQESLYESFNKSSIDFQLWTTLSNDISPSSVSILCNGALYKPESATLIIFLVKSVCDSIKCIDCAIPKVKNNCQSAAELIDLIKTNALNIWDSFTLGPIKFSKGPYRMIIISNDKITKIRSFFFSNNIESISICQNDIE